MEPKLIDRYYAEFGEFPPLFTTMSYEDDWYQEKMKKAIESGQPITTADLDEIQDADLVTDSKGGKSLPGFGAKK